MGTPITAGTFMRHFMPKNVEFIKNTLNMRLKASEWRKFFKTQSTKEIYIETETEETSGTARQIVEMGMPPLIRPERGHTKRIAVTEYAAMGQYSRWVQNLGKTDLIKKITECVRDAPVDLYEVICAAYIEFGDTALAGIPTVNGIPMIDPIGGDKKTLFAVDHCYNSDDGANTFSNKPTWASFSQVAIEDMFNLVEGWTDNQGRLLKATIDEIVVPRALQFRAKEIIGSQGRSDTANRADNALRAKLSPTDYFVYKNQINQTEYGARTNVPTDLRFVQAWDAQVDTEYDKKIGVASVILSICFGHGFNDPRSIVFAKR